MPDGHFHVFILSKRKVNSMLFTLVKPIFKSEDQWPSYMFFEFKGLKLALLVVTALPSGSIAAWPGFSMPYLPTY